jgi:hypothetical protein
MSATSNDATTAFPSAMDAKEFLASRIAAEAEREGKPLSDLARKQLFFSETHESLPNMLDLTQQFHDEQGGDDDTEYEARIAALARAAYDRDAENSPVERERWDDAIRRLEREDHYIVIMLHHAGLGSLPKPANFDVFAFGFLLVVLAIVVFSYVVAPRYHIPVLSSLTSRDAQRFTLLALVVFAVLYISRRRAQ